MICAVNDFVWSSQPLNIIFLPIDNSRWPSHQLTLSKDTKKNNVQISSCLKILMSFCAHERFMLIGRKDFKDIIRK